MTQTRHLVFGGLAGWEGLSLAGLGIDECNALVLARSGRRELPLRQGQLVAAALDAGEESSWYRVTVDAEVPPGSSIAVEVAAASSLPLGEADAIAARELPIDYEPPNLAPTDGLLNFATVSSLDFAIPTVLGATTDPTAEPERHRYLWLRIRLSATSDTTPVLRGVHLRTTGEGFLAHLPAVYRNRDLESGRFLELFLEMLGSAFGDLSQAQRSLPNRIDPAMAEPEHLPWLAEWLGWRELPVLPCAELRGFVLGLHELAALRGTAIGLRRMIAAFTGINVNIVEQFTQRRFWLLGSAEIGIDTGLSLQPDGMTVPGDTDAGASASSGTNLVVGEARVGNHGPLKKEHLGLPLFEQDAHRFAVIVPPGAACSPRTRGLLRHLVDAEKPAHTDYHLCFLERIQVGVHMRLGIDAYVGSAHQPEPLGHATLGQDTYVAPDPGSILFQENDTLRQGDSSQ